MCNKFVWWFITIIIMTTIFSFSSQPKAESNALSMKITEKIIERSSLSQDDDGSENFMKWNNFFRKFAHFSLFLLLGVSAFMALKYQFYYKNLVNIWLITLLFCILYAVSDEIHQIFVPGRGCQFIDVVIDFSGSFLGSLGAFGAVKLYEYRIVK